MKTFEQTKQISSCKGFLGYKNKSFNRTALEYLVKVFDEYARIHEAKTKEK